MITIRLRRWSPILLVAFALTLEMARSAGPAWGADASVVPNTQVAGSPQAKAVADAPGTPNANAVQNTPASTDKSPPRPDWTARRPYVALAMALLSIVAAAGLLYWFAERLGVPGSSVILRIISSSYGWASLAQLQIILWTLVIGGGAVFVMVLRGDLITIGTTTLSLLGIAGVAGVGSQIRSAQQVQAAASPSQATAAANTSAPGPISLLTQRAPMSESEIALTWPAPTGGAASCSYAVYYRLSAAAPNNNPWFVGATRLTEPGITLIGLAPAMSYDVQVVATNANGSNTPATATFSTGAAIAPPAGAPAMVTGLAIDATPADAPSFRVVWRLQVGVTFEVQYRTHESAESWRSGPVTPLPSAVLTGLRPATAYDVRVIATNAGTNGPPSAIITGQTGSAAARRPQWTDLVTDTDRAAEIDVTRVQMLFFTVISACYVALHIISDGAIQEVGATYVELMGLSNGVYLTSKYLSR